MLNEEREPMFFVWELDRRVVRCAKYRGIPRSKEIAKLIVSKRLLDRSEEHLSIEELATKYPYQS
jgi:hypothetical protein